MRPFSRRSVLQLSLFSALFFSVTSCLPDSESPTLAPDLKTTYWPANPVCLAPTKAPPAIPRPDGSFGYESWAPPQAAILHFSDLEGVVKGEPPTESRPLLSLDKEALSAWKREVIEDGVQFSNLEMGSILAQADDLLLEVRPAKSTHIKIAFPYDSSSGFSSTDPHTFSYPRPAEHPPEKSLSVSLNVKNFLKGNFNFAERRSALTSMTISFHGGEPGEASLESLVFEDPLLAYNKDAAGKADIELQNVIRPSWFIHSGNAVQFEVTIPRGESELRWHSGHLGESTVSEVRVISSLGVSKRLSKGRDPDRWRHESAKLSQWSGETVKIEFRTTGGGIGLLGDARIVGVQPSKNTPNVIVYLIDTLRADHISAWSGEFEGTSPTIDRLAKEGVMFSRTQSPAPWTKPTMASLMTGIYPAVHRAEVPGSRLHPTVPTLQKSLRRAGWRAGSFTSSALGSTLGGLEQGFDVAYPPRFWSGQIGDLGHPTADQLHTGFFEWLEEEPNEPFFAYFHTLEVHEHHKPRYRDKVSDFHDAYLGALQDADQKLKVFLDALMEKGILENTLLILVSDHGEALGQHQRYGHGFWLYQHQLHVPMLFWAGDSLPQMNITERVSSVGLPNTILDLVGLPPLEHSQVQSLKGLIDGVTTSEAPYIPSTRFQFYYDPKGARLWSILTPENKKLLEIEGRAFRLYDLAEGECETHYTTGEGLKKGPEYEMLMTWKAEQEQLRAAFLERHPIVSRDSGEEDGNNIDADSIEELRALGYMD